MDEMGERLKRACSTSIHSVEKVIKEVGIDHIDFNYRARHYNDPPLLVALRRRHVDVANLLLRCGSDPNAINNDGETPLTFAIKKLPPGDEMVGCIALLLAYGADPNIIGRESYGSLYWAVRKLYHPIVKMLMMYGAKFDRVKLRSSMTERKIDDYERLYHMRTSLRDMAVSCMRVHQIKFS
jgi:ankyrin repeat protein